MVAEDEADYKDRFADHELAFLPFPSDHKGQNPFNDLKYLYRLYRLYKIHQPDMVHHFTIKPVLYGSMAAKWAGVPVIVNTITGLGYAFETKNVLLRQYVLSLYRRALSGRPRVIFQNPDDRQLFIEKKLCEHKKASVILGSGVNTDLIKPGSDGDAIAEKGVTFLLISRMLWSKGIKEFVQAAGEVNARYTDTQFLMIGGHSGGGARGNPSDTVPLEWLEEVNAKGTVHWIGRVPFETVLRQLDESHVVVLPSYYPEGVPRTLIEAAAKQKAIVTTDMPGCRETVADGVNGFLVPPRSVTDLVKSMTAFIENPALIEKMGIESRKRAVRLFDEKSVVEQTFGVYRKAGLS